MTGLHLVCIGFPLFYRFFIRYYLVSPSYAQLKRIEPSCTGFFLDITGSDLVLLGSCVCVFFSPGFTGFFERLEPIVVHVHPVNVRMELSGRVGCNHRVGKTSRGSSAAGMERPSGRTTPPQRRRRKRLILVTRRSGNGATLTGGRFRPSA